MEAVLTVISKVAVMLILIVVGYLVTKKGMLTERGASEITTLLIQIVTPCLIVNSFLTSEDSLSAGELLLSVGTSALAIALSIGLSLLFFRKEPEGRKKVLRFAVSFSNAGFMGLPLVEGIVGSKGVMYGSFFIVVFNIFCWTYGYSMMSGGQKMSLKVLLFNPGIIGLLFGLPIYFLDLHLPAVIAEPVGFFADLNTPLAMLIIGSYVANPSSRIVRCTRWRPCGCWWPRRCLWCACCSSAPPRSCLSPALSRPPARWPPTRCCSPCSIKGTPPWPRKRWR